MAYTFPHTLTPGTPENVTDVMDNFSGLATDTEYAYSTYKALVPWTGSAGSLANGAGTGAVASSGVLTVPAGGVYYLDPADFTANARTTKYRLRAFIGTNQVAPGMNFVFGLYPATFVAAAAGSVNGFSYGTVTSGSTVTFNAPSASTIQQGNSGDFTAPVAGYYSLGIAYSGAANPSSRTDVFACLQVRQV